jgi:sec-independent protein translocase protein TatA
MMPGPAELILILLIVVVVFGAKRIPEIMQGLGHGIREFKKSMENDEPSPLVSSQTEANPSKPGSTPPREHETK